MTTHRKSVELQSSKGYGKEVNIYPYIPTMNPFVHDYGAAISGKPTYVRLRGRESNDVQLIHIFGSGVQKEMIVDPSVMLASYGSMREVNMEDEDDKHLRTELRLSKSSQ